MKWLCHKLFGWEYYVIPFGSTDYLCRARTGRDGTKYAIVCGCYRMIRPEHYRVY